MVGGGKQKRAKIQNLRSKLVDILAKFKSCSSSVFRNSFLYKHRKLALNNKRFHFYSESYLTSQVLLREIHQLNVFTLFFVFGQLTCRSKIFCRQKWLRFEIRRFIRDLQISMVKRTPDKHQMFLAKGF